MTWKNAVRQFASWVRVSPQVKSAANSSSVQVWPMYSVASQTPEPTPTAAD